MDLILYAHSKRSAGVRHLRTALADYNVEARFLDPETAARRIDEDDLVFGWGASSPPYWDKPGLNWVNHPDNVKKAINKIRTFDALKRAEVACPDYTIDHAVASGWAQGGDTVFGRSCLSGKGGEGIVILNENSLADAPACPLYTRYVKPKFELRIIVLNGKVVSTTRKRKRITSYEGEPHPLIRTYSNGWIYSVNDVPDVGGPEACAAVAALGLQFGAVDVIIESKTAKPHVLEVNTAPGLDEDSTNLTLLRNAVAHLWQAHCDERITSL